MPDAKPATKAKPGPDPVLDADLGDVPPGEAELEDQPTAIPPPRVVNGIPVFSTSPLLPADRAKVHPDNPREGDVGAISESIRINGFWGSILVQASTGLILKGNHTYQAAVALGMELLPFDFIDVSDMRARAILLADNAASDLASNNEAKLAALLQQHFAETGNFAGTLHDGDDLDAMLERLGEGGSDPDFDPSPQLAGLEFRVVVVCKDETQQRELLDRFTIEGLDASAVVS